ncbi:MAG: pyridoxal phosphate-dependent aminotransferase [Lachnospiraceae bacterium]|nr:pyridoxal phosphate-dependent aminotransferase [Lachnospiraceae bacterium]
MELSRKALSVKPSSTLTITAKANELRAAGEDVVGFAAGEPDFPTPAHICEAAKKAIDDGFTKYTPASGTAELKKAISEKFKRVNGISYAPSQIIISNGGKHSLTNTFEALLNYGDEVIIPAPYWLSYPEIVKLAGGVPVIIRAEKGASYKVTAEQIEAACTEKTKALVLNSPNNPTGMIYTKEELQAIAEVAIRKNFYVVSDEIYENLYYMDGKNASIASLGEEIYNRTITVNGLAKSYAMTGWRIGYLGAPADIAKCISSIQSHQTSNPNSIAQKAALAAIEGDQQCVDDMNKAFDERRQYMYKRVCDTPHISCLEPKGAFYVFVDMSEIIGMKYKGREITCAADMAEILIADYCVAIVPCADFGFADHFRMSYAISVEKIKKGMDRIEQFISALED